ncbi:MAG TPA: PQQ-dependent sugar dehydrogenase [Chloroflexota bacterium]|nr:PQQ-dependent sugar dehydrogenase [Chloroflexota bacterium]
MARLVLALTAAAALLVAAACAGQPTPTPAAPARVPAAAAPAPLAADQPAPRKSDESVPTPAATPAGKPVTTVATTPVAAKVTPAVAGAPPPSPTAAAAGATRPADTATSGAPRPAGTPTVKVEVVLRGLETPWAIAFAPDGRWFITERPGRIRVVENGRLQPEPWMTFDVWEQADSEAGLLGIALDPTFAENHFVYLAYTYPAGGRLQNRLVRLREDPSTRRGVQDRVLFDGVLGNQNHDGGRVKFGPDGKLYWTMGESFIPNLAQDQASPSGKILRLNPDGSIPADNPFPGSPVYSMGHRNPQGLAWQPSTGRLYATEHGPSGQQGCCHDELNYIEPGKNYGWPTIRGDQTRAGLETPILESGASTTWAPSGATFVTRGPWAGSLLFTGLRGQALYRVAVDQQDPRKAQLVETLLARQYGRLRDAVEGPDGALYVLTSNRDGRGAPAADDDRVLRLTVSA